MKPSAILLFLSAALVSQQPGAVEITAETHHRLTMENEQVRVFQVEVPSNTETLMHWHRHDYIYVTLGPTELVNNVEGRPPATLKLQNGETRFSPGPFAHAVRTISSTPFRNVTIEILQDEKLRRAPSPWKEDRGIDILHGGTGEILFVKDALRITEFDLQPGGMVPMHHHAGKHLMVAVNDFEIRSDVQGKAATPGHFKSGDAKWLPANYSHAITNTGHHPAKFVTVEFP